MIDIEIYSNDFIKVSNNIVADSVLHKKIRFSFPEHWKDTVKTAVFINGETVVNVLLNSDSPLYVSENVYYIPHEVIKAPEFEISVFGFIGSSTLTTDKGVIKVRESGMVEGQAPSEPTPSEYQQLIEAAQNAETIAQSVRDDADNGAFNGKEGKEGPPGKNGVDGEQGPRGFSGCFPLVNIEYAPTVTIPVNSECTIGAMEGDIDISLSAPEAGYSSEWVFYITQGETAYDIALPEIEWELGIAPTFSANSTTEVRLHYKGNALQGVWL